MILPPSPRSIRCRATAREQRKRALDVDGLHLVPGGFAQIDDWDAVWSGARASVVDQQVDAAKAGERVLHHALDLVGIGHVGLHCEGLLTSGFDFGDEGG